MTAQSTTNTAPQPADGKNPAAPKRPRRLLHASIAAAALLLVLIAAAILTASNEYQIDTSTGRSRLVSSTLGITRSITIQPTFISHYATPSDRPADWRTVYQESTGARVNHDFSAAINAPKNLMDLQHARGFETDAVTLLADEILCLWRQPQGAVAANDFMTSTTESLATPHFESLDIQQRREFIRQLCACSGASPAEPSITTPVSPPTDG